VILFIYFLYNLKENRTFIPNINLRIMKKLLILTLLCGCMACFEPVCGQTTRALPAASGKASANAVLYTLPQTVLDIEITVRQEIIRRGPYARFAQQFLGAVAPLSDKELYTLLGAEIGYSTESDPSAVYALEAPDKTPFDLYRQTPGGAVVRDGLFDDQKQTPERKIDRFSMDNNASGALQVDKMDMANPSLEAAAAEAARMLFTLRKRRFDLITGEAGENVYGAGMQAALDEMRRLEDEYTALFLGQRTSRLITRTLTVIPQAGMNRVIVCRFSDEGGLLPDSDLSGRPIVLELTPENKAAAVVGGRAPGKDPRGTVFMRVADPVRCRLIDDKSVLVDRRIPVYQFGQVVDVPVTSSK
jgi:hypothetical protein